MAVWAWAVTAKLKLKSKQKLRRRQIGKYLFEHAVGAMVKTPCGVEPRPLYATMPPGGTNLRAVVAMEGCLFVSSRPLSWGLLYKVNAIT